MFLFIFLSLIILISLFLISNTKYSQTVFELRQNNTMPGYSVQSQVRELKMSRLDDLLQKNQEISMNVKQKLHKINKSHQNINVNINNIRPMSYGSSNNYSKSNHDSSPIETQRRKPSQLYQLQKSKHLIINNDNSQQITFNQAHRQQTDLKETISPFAKSKQEYLIHTQKVTTQKFPKTAINNPNLDQIKKRKKEVERIYNQLKMEQQIIQEDYQSFKRSRLANLEQRQKHQNFMNNYQKEEYFKETPSRKSQIITEESQKLKIQEAKNQNKIKSNILSISEEQINQIFHQPHPSKPEPFSANSCLFIPFNKLYRSPILQKTSNNFLTLNRMSKTTNYSNDKKIINGIKYKYSQLQTDQQNLIVNTLQNKSHNHIAIVGAKDTLKKKMHMAYMAHAFYQILSIFNSKAHNFLIFNITYQEVVSNINDPFIIQNSIELQKQTLKIGVMHIQRTIEDIYEAIKKGSNKNSLQKSGINFQKYKNSTMPINTGGHQKLLRCTKMTLFSGRDYLWSCTIISTNRFDMQFLKCLQVQSIVWSLNPLIKNYEDVCHTLNQMKLYNEMKNRNK